MLPAPGDKITAIDDKVYRAIVGRGGHGLAPGYFRWHPASKRTATRAYREDTEGLSWIRGWHEPDSDEVRALLAANKLEASALSFTGASITLKVKGIPFPIEFADWTHDRLYVRG